MRAHQQILGPENRVYFACPECWLTSRYWVRKLIIAGSFCLSGILAHQQILGSICIWNIMIVGLFCSSGMVAYQPISGSICIRKMIIAGLCENADLTYFFYFPAHAHRWFKHFWPSLSIFWVCMCMCIDNFRISGWVFPLPRHAHTYTFMMILAFPAKFFHFLGNHAQCTCTHIEYFSISRWVFPLSGHAHTCTLMLLAFPAELSIVWLEMHMWIGYFP